jgi:hypothetical protein
MCECGCAEGMAAVFTFEGPPGITYAIGKYPGCRDCSNPAALMLYAIPDSEREHFLLDEIPLPDAPWQTLYGWREIAIPFKGKFLRATP